MCLGLRVKYPLFLSYFNETSTFLTGFRKIPKYKISRKSVQWEPSFSMRTHGLTDMTKLLAAFRNFANAPKTHSYYSKRPRLVAIKSVFYHMRSSTAIVNTGTTCLGVMPSSRSSSSHSTHCIIFSGSAGGGYTSSLTSCLLQLQYAVDTWTRAWKKWSLIGSDKLMK